MEAAVKMEEKGINPPQAGCTAGSERAVSFGQRRQRRLSLSTISPLQRLQAPDPRHHVG